MEAQLIPQNLHRTGWWEQTKKFTRKDIFFLFLSHSREKAPVCVRMFEGTENLHRIGVKAGDSARFPELIEDQDVMNDYRPSRQNSRDHYSVEAHRLGAPGLQNVIPYYAAKAQQKHYL